MCCSDCLTTARRRSSSMTMGDRSPSTFWERSGCFPICPRRGSASPSTTSNPAALSRWGLLRSAAQSRRRTGQLFGNARHGRADRHEGGKTLFQSSERDRRDDARRSLARTFRDRRVEGAQDDTRSRTNGNRDAQRNRARRPCISGADQGCRIPSRHVPDESRHADQIDALCGGLERDDRSSLYVTEFCDFASPDRPLPEIPHRRGRRRDIPAASVYRRVLADPSCTDHSRNRA